MTQIDSKKHRATHEFQGTDMSSTNKRRWYLQLKKGMLYKWKKKDLEESLLFRKPVHFSVKNTSNHADT